MSIAKYIDATILRPDTTFKEVKDLYDYASKEGCASVCIPSVFLSNLITSEFGGFPWREKAKIKISTVLNFPNGTSSIEEIVSGIRCVEDCVDEIDIVVPLPLFRSWPQFMGGTLGVIRKATDKMIKIIIETDLLSTEEIITLSKLCVETGMDYVKTNTGFGKRGVTVDDVKLIKGVVGDKCKIKAAGGIKTYEQAIALIGAGASRIGTSCAKEIMAGRGKK